MYLQLTMGSEDVDVQCHQQPASISDLCDSTTSVGIAAIPFLTNPSPMSVAQNQAGTPTPASVSNAMLAHSAASHTPPQNVTVHQPSVAASPLPHVQVIQQPLQNQYLQHLYAPQQQHMFLPGNLTIQPTIQSLTGAPGLSLQLQGKPLDNKAGTPTIISASPLQAGGNYNGPNLMTAGGQMITAGAKTCVQGQMLTASTKSTAVIQGQSGFIPSTTANQTVVIGQLGVLSNQPSVISHQAKALQDSQKSKSFLISQPATLHPKSPILPSPNASCGATGQMIASNQMKQIPAPHIISSQAPTMIASQAQILGSLQALGASLPPGLTWATPAPLHSSALFGQNPIFIRSQQSDMFIQTPPPQATIHTVPMTAAAPTAPAPVPAQPQPPPPVAAPPNSSPQVQKVKQVRPASSVATQTAVSTTAAASPHVSATKTQVKQRSRSQQLRSSPALSNGIPATQLQTATTQTQTSMPSHQKADACNQTRPTHEIRVATTHHKSSGTDAPLPIPEQKVEKIIITQQVQPTIASPPCMNVVATSTADIAIVAPSVVELEDMRMDIEESPLTQALVESIDSKQKDKENESVGIVAPMPEVIVKETVKQPQKAIVKPHVLTHVIEGFVIQEGSEPFPVTRPSLQNSTSSPKSPGHEKAVEMGASMPPVMGVQAFPKKKEKIPKIRGPVELAKCEFCGKLGPKSKFKRSKRFCSTSCAKRYNVGCSKRHAAVPPDQEQKNPASGKSAKKKKLGFKSKKGWRKSQNRSYDVSEWVQPQEIPLVVEDVKISLPEVKNEEPQNIEVEFETNDIPLVGEDSVSPIMAVASKEESENEAAHPCPAFATKSALKWTVTDVVDFVRALPGCSDYADEFRSQEIDGQALLLLKEDHLMSAMSMKLGPALKVCARINVLKDEANH